MGRKVYYYTNLEYLCEKNNITREYLREKLGMSLLQMSYPYYPRASKQIADFFGITVDAYLYDDLSVPEKFRFLSNSNEKEMLCDELQLQLENGVDEWVMANCEDVERLYGGLVYKQIAFQIEKGDYRFLIIYNVTHDGEVEPDNKVFPMGCYAYGYVDYGNKYTRYYMSFEDSKFRKLCDKILDVKNYTIDKWNTKEQYRRKINHSVTLDFSLSKKDINDYVSSSLTYAFLFGKDNWLVQSEEERLDVVNKTISLLIKLKQNKCLNKEELDGVDVGVKDFFMKFDIEKIEFSEETTESINKIEEVLGILKVTLEKEVERKEIERIEEEDRKKSRNLLIQEMVADRMQIGKWSLESVENFKEYISGLSEEQFFSELKMIASITKEDIDDMEKYTDEEIKVLKNFLWAKRIYTYNISNNIDELLDMHVYFGNYKKTHICMLLAFVNAFKQQKVYTYYSGLSTSYAEILVILFGLKRETIDVIKQIRDMHMLYEGNNCIIDSIYEDMCVINCIPDGSIENKNVREFCIKDVIYLSNAQWTNFFEDTDDKVMYLAFEDVYQYVRKLFEENNVDISHFFEGREGRKKYVLFQMQYNSGLDKFGAIINIPEKNTEFIRNGKRYLLINGKMYIEGLLETIELKDSNNNYSSFPLIDRYLATYIWKYMENYLRILSKFKTKCSYKYGGDYCFEPFINDPNTLKEVAHDYEILRELIDSGILRKTIYDAMKEFMVNNMDELEWWKDRFK